MAKLLLARIDSLPDAERGRAFELATGTKLPKEVSAEQWIRHDRQKWFFLLVGAGLIAIITVVAIALIQPNEKEFVTKVQDVVSSTAAQTAAVVTSESTAVQVGLWRDRYGMGEVSGGAWIKIELKAGQPTAELGPWLARVQEYYRKAKAAGGDIGTDWVGSDVKGDDYLDINSGTTPKKHWDLAPRGDQEQFVDKLLFNARYLLLATSGTKRGLLLSPLSFDEKASSVKIYFDPSSQKATRGEWHASGPGSFSPVPGQFTNWLDFYGATLIARQLIGYPAPSAFEMVDYQSITFESKGDHWTRSATFAAHTGADLYTDDERSLIVQNADWRTLGQVPGDYPGQRIALYGEKPSPW